jgi:hypothetical protein
MSDLVFTMIEGSRITLPIFFASCVVGAFLEGQLLMSAQLKESTIPMKKS